MKQNILEVIPAKWQEKNIRYLGVNICRTNEQMLKENITPMITYMEDKCHVWDMYKLSWQGRVVAVKVVLLPKLVFVLLNTTLDIPEALLNKMQAIVNKFIWNNKKPRMLAVEKRLQNGGLAIPNIRKYYHAAPLVACLD